MDFTHAAGASVAYETTLCIETSVAQKERDRFIENNNTCVPEGFILGRMVQFAADNFDHNEETVDGKGTFHIKVQPKFPELIKPEWFHSSSSKTFVQKNNKVDLAWILSTMSGSDNQKVPSWTHFNERNSSVQIVSKVGNLPIIPNPAHEFDSVMTMVVRFQRVAAKLLLKYTVITLDQALYHKANDLFYLLPDKFNHVVIGLGAFHLTLNVMGAVGRHTLGSGLTNAWMQSGIHSDVTAERIIKCKHYNRAVGAHKSPMKFCHL